MTRRFLDGYVAADADNRRKFRKALSHLLWKCNHEQRLGRETQKLWGDVPGIRRILKERNISYLSDRSVHLNEEISISGLNLDPACYRDFIPGPHENGLSGTASGSCGYYAFSDSPGTFSAYFEQYADWGADLTLSGHFHGGTIRLPFVGGVMTRSISFSIRTVPVSLKKMENT